MTSGRTTTETLNETYQAENLTVSVEAGGTELRIRRQGGPGVDLTGNVAVKVGIRLDGSDKVALYHAGDLFGADQQPVKPDKVVLTRALVDVGPYADLSATVAMTYVMRHVKTGGGTLVSRGQDVLEHTRTMAPVTQVLVARDDLYPASFGLYTAKRPEPLSVQTPGVEPNALCLSTYAEADDLLRYLRIVRPGGVLGKASIGWFALTRNTPLAAADLDQLEVRSNCVAP